MSALARHLNPVKAALHIARRAHDGQRDKAGEPYIYHPLRVVRAMAPDDVAGQVVAALHDVIEDTPVTIYELVLFGFSEEIVRAVDALTHRREETYRQYLERVANNPLARRVKLADIADNANEARLGTLRVEDAQRLREKYVQARAYLERASTPPQEQRPAWSTEAFEAAVKEVVSWWQPNTHRGEFEAELRAAMLADLSAHGRVELRVDYEPQGTLWTSVLRTGMDVRRGKVSTTNLFAHSKARVVLDSKAARRSIGYAAPYEILWPPAEGEASP